MIVDSSALLSILFQEDDASKFAVALETNWPLYMSVANYVEASIVVEARSDKEGLLDLRKLIDRVGIGIVDVTRRQAEIAISAIARYGKGRHKAGLNYGDSFAYALAVDAGEPLLYKGEDFAITDVVAAV